MVEHELGMPVEPDRLREVIAATPNVKAVGVVHAETSTGTLTSLPEISRIAHDAGALLVVDAVTSLGGVELQVDEWGIDVCYSCTQKCVGAPPGLAPLTLSPRAVDVMQSRTSKVQSFYLDLSELTSYWDRRAYHHTAPISMIYALREALRIIGEEGIESRWERHSRNAGALHAGLEAMGLTIVADEAVRLPSITAIRSPEGIDEAAVRRYLLGQYDIEVSGGLGALAGKAWRIGLMGQNSTASNVLTFLGAFEDALSQQGYESQAGAGVAAAQRNLRGRRLGLHRLHRQDRPAEIDSAPIMGSDAERLPRRWRSLRQRLPKQNRGFAVHPRAFRPVRVLQIHPRHRRLHDAHPCVSCGVLPLARGEVPGVRRVAPYLDAMHPRLGLGVVRRDRVDEDELAPGAEHARNLPQPCLHVDEVMRRGSARDQVDAPVAIGKGLSGCQHHLRLRCAAPPPVAFGLAPASPA